MKLLKLSLVWVFLVALLIPAVLTPQKVHAEGVDFQGFRFTYIEAGTDTDPSKPADGKANDEPNIEPVLGYRPSGGNDDPYIVYKYNSQLNINDTPYTVFNETFCFDNLGSVCPGIGEFSEYFVLINSETFDAFECGVRNGVNEEDRLNECSQLIANGTISTGGDEYPISVPTSPIYAQSFSPEAIDESGGEVPTFNDDGSGTTSEEGESCEGRTGAMGWLLCQGLRLVGYGLSVVDGQIQALLSVPPEYYGEGGTAGEEFSAPGAPTAWRSLRNMAYSLLVIIALVMVVSTALGFEFFSAYTIKRALPRFVIAVIFIALSFELTKLAVVITDDVGRGLLGFSAGAFGAVDDSGNVVSLVDILGSGQSDGGALTDLISSGAILAGAVWLVTGGFFVLLGLAGSVLIILLGLLILLMFRQILIVFLMITAPLAILSWIFPGNDKLWGIWKSTFIGLLALFPIVTLMIGVGRGFATIVDGSIGPESPPLQQILAVALKLIAYVAPYFLIPTAFKFAGSAFNNIAGMVNNREKGLADRSKAWGKLRSGKEEKTARRKELLKQKNQYNSLDQFGPATSGPFKKRRTQLRNIRNSGPISGIRTEELRAAQEAQSQQDMKQAAFALDKGGIDDHLSEFSLSDGTKLSDKRAALVAIAKGQKVKNQNGEYLGSGDKASRRAAANVLAQQGDIKGLRDLDKARNDSSIGIDERRTISSVLTEATQGNIGSVMPKAPDLIKGDVGSFGDFKAEEMVGWDPTTVEKAFKFVSSPSNFSSPQDHQLAINGLQESLLAARNNDDVRGDVKAGFVKAVSEAHAKHLSTAPAGISITGLSTEITTNYRSDGSLGAKDPTRTI